MLAAFVVIEAPIRRNTLPALACHVPPVSLPAAKFDKPVTVMIPPESEAIVPFESTKPAELVPTVPPAPWIVMPGPIVSVSPALGTVRPARNPC